MCAWLWSARSNSGEILANVRLPCLTLECGDDDALGVDVETCPGDNLLHGWLLRMRLWPRVVRTPPRLIRALAQ